MSNDDASLREQHLDWSSKQGRILTANGTASSLYTSERGFSFRSDELPHHFLQLGTIHDVHPRLPNTQVLLPIVGAWKRTFFYGGWEYTCEADEITFNLQTHSLFIDLRIPRSRNELLRNRVTASVPPTSLDDLDATQLRYYARQHCFAGYTHGSFTDDAASRTGMDCCCTRHHCIDWNYVGTGRDRPNKWWVQLHENQSGNTWKEWAYATNDCAQHYYCEQWERLPQDDPPSNVPVVAFRKRRNQNSPERDGVLVIVGDHFNYCVDRQSMAGFEKYAGCTSLVATVDAAIKADDLVSARAWLSLRGGHGRISEGWIVDNAIEFWTEGKALWEKEDLSTTGNALEDFCLVWNGEPWDLYESNVQNTHDLKILLHTGLRKRTSTL